MNGSCTRFSSDCGANSDSNNWMKDVMFPCRFSMSFFTFARCNTSGGWPNRTSLCAQGLCTRTWGHCGGFDERPSKRFQVWSGSNVARNGWRHQRNENRWSSKDANSWQFGLWREALTFSSRKDGPATISTCWSDCDFGFHSGFRCSLWLWWGRSGEVDKSEDLEIWRFFRWRGYSFESHFSITLFSDASRSANRGCVQPGWWKKCRSSRCRFLPIRKKWFHDAASWRRKNPMCEIPRLDALAGGERDTSSGPRFANAHDSYDIWHMSYTFLSEMCFLEFL